MMFELATSGPNDLPTIQDWVAADNWHRNQTDFSWWLTGNGFLSFKVKDARGTICFVRIDREDRWLRLNCQFSPIELTGRRRLILSTAFLFKTLEKFFDRNDTQGVRFNSESPSLIKLVLSRGFRLTDQGDYAYDFGGNH